MAHFAKISEDNRILQVLAVDDKDVKNENDVETESVGQAYLETHNNWPANMWIQTSYNTFQNTHKEGGTPFRGNYAIIGGEWDSTNEIFWPEQPFASWTKDIASAKWLSPLGEAPEISAEQQSQNDAGTHMWNYNWDEDAYQADNTTGWFLRDNRTI
jgi:hypothetical protein